MQTILIVDDRPVNREFLATLLGYGGYRLLEAPDGEEALRIVRSQRPDLVIADILMPKMDGFAFVNRLRADPDAWRTPVIFFTAYYNEREANALAESCGVVRVLSKPAEPGLILDTVRHALEQGAHDPAALPAQDFDRDHMRLLTDMLSRKAESLESMNQRFMSLIQLGQRLASEQDPIRLLSSFADALRELTGAPRAVIAVCDDSGPEREHLIPSGLDEEAFARLAAVPAQEALTPRLLRLPLPARFDAESLRAHVGDLPEAYPPFESLLAARLATPFQSYGVLWAADKPGGFTEADQHVAESVASVAAVAYANALRYRQVRDYADRLEVEVAQRRRAEHALTASEHKYRRLVQSLPAAVYTTDAEGRVTLYNDAAVALWGREPDPDRDPWCGSWKIYTPGGVELPVDQCPMAVAVRERRPVIGEEVVIERPDGTRRHVLPHPRPIFDCSGAMVGAINMLVDITEQKRVEKTLRENEARLRAMFGQAAVGIALVGEDGRFLEANDRLCQILGRPAQELRRMTCEELTHPDDWEANEALIRGVLSGQHAEFSYEKRYRRSDGSWVWVDITASLLQDGETGPRRFIAVVQDIDARKLAEQELRLHREALEQLVQERTAELEESHEKLRISERMASIGTLAAGLGHDMGNLLLPINCRLDVLKVCGLPDDAMDHIRAVDQAVSYLGSLTTGLRMLARDPDLADNEPTRLHEWRSSVHGLFRTAVTDGIELQWRLPAGLPAVHLAPHKLTQAVFNLASNAGDALAGIDGGRVIVSAEAADDGLSVLVRVSDNGPGMPEEVQRRAVEPFFTTKKRTASTGTGLGLALVRSIVGSAGGELSIESAVGRGTTVTLTLPAAVEEDSPERERDTGADVAVTIHDERLGSLIVALLRSRGLSVLTPEEGPVEHARILLSDTCDRCYSTASSFVQSGSGKQACVVGPAQERWARLGAIHLGESPTPDQIRDRVGELLQPVAAAT